jgi:hypothetical protein
VPVVASVVGVPGDPQAYAAQVERLEAAGAWVLPSNAQAVRAAAMIAGRASGPVTAPARRREASPTAASESPLTPGARDRIVGFLGSEISVVNIGLEAFGLDLARRNVPVVHGLKPPAGGNLRSRTSRATRRSDGATSLGDDRAEGLPGILHDGRLRVAGIELHRARAAGRHLVGGLPFASVIRPLPS